MKKCSRCKQEKQNDGFYQDKMAKDGYNGICKECRLTMDRARRKNNPEWVAKRKLHNKKYHQENREAIAERKKRWLASEEGKESHRKSTRKWKRKNREKVLAHSAVERAVARGELIPPKTCQFCGSEKRIEAHHHDYRKRLSVIWLCKYCHEKLT